MVAGSIPVCSAIYQGRVTQRYRVVALQATGRVFESRRAHHFPEESMRVVHCDICRKEMPQGELRGKAPDGKEYRLFIKTVIDGKWKTQDICKQCAKEIVKSAKD